MSIKKTNTLALDDLPEPWAKLSPIASSQVLPVYELNDPIVSIGRNADCIVKILDKRLSGKHCSISFDKDLKKIHLTDESTNGTFIGINKIGKGKTEELSNLQEIWLLPASRVPVAETIGFKIQFLFNKKELQEKAEKQQIEKKKNEEAAKIKEKEKEKEKDGNDQLAKSIKEQITCSFCYEIMCIPVSVQPCNHRFCGACLTELVEKKKDTCIQCRKQITTAVRDASFNSIIEDYLKSHADEKRDPKEEEESKKKNIFGFDPLDVKLKIHGKPAVKKVQKAPVASRGRRGRSALMRASSDLSASEDEADKCRECANQRNGFKCTSSQLHIGCHTCGKLIAQRDDPSLHQSCLLCTTYFCNLYFPPCVKTGTKLHLLESKRAQCKIDAALIRGNIFEFQSIRNYLQSKKLTSKDVFDHMMDVIGKGKFSYAFDKKFMKVPPIVSKEVKIEKDSAICDLCWNDLWFQMVFAYRHEVNSQLPSTVKDRPSCYWGVNCRTMDHNIDHAKKYNHMLHQTRF